MKLRLIILFSLGWVFPFTAWAAIQIPGADGSSGVLNITEDTTIDLSLAGDGAWDDPNTADGLYDADQWAVVFNYSSVNIDPDVTLTFINHPSRAPVVWLVTGDVTISGTVSLDGSDAIHAPSLAEPGPGGFRGATGTYSGVTDSAGFGPGGGFVDRQGGNYGEGSRGYGNPSLVPLIGGSGGSAAPGDRTLGGGGGGGALLIACAATVTIDGEFRANGGDGLVYQYSNRTGAGSGGGLRIVCDTLTGAGPFNALAGTSNGGGAASVGRIRLERVVSASTSSITPDPSVVPLTAGDTALLWPPSTAPRIEVVSIGGVGAPADPRAAFGATGADVALPETTSTPIVIRTTNVEEASTVEVRVTPRSGADAEVIDAAVDTVESATEPILLWTADLPVLTGYSAVQVRVVRP